MMKEELVWLAAYNLAAVITETQPNASGLLDLLHSELLKLVQEENSHWLGVRLPDRLCRMRNA